MHAFLRHITAWSLSALLILSTLSFTVDMHFCGRHLVDIGINSMADGCGMMPDGVKDECGMASVKPGMGCCQDVEFAVTGHEDLQVANAYSMPLIHVAMLEIPDVTIPENFLNATGNERRQSGYQPPPPQADRLALYQVFRI